MNKVRRKALAELVKDIEGIQERLDELTQEEQDYLDNIPENLQGSERYSVAEDAVSCLEEAVSALDEALDNINSAIGE